MCQAWFRARSGAAIRPRKKMADGLKDSEPLTADTLTLAGKE